MAQSKAHIQATTRYEKKAYDKILVRLRKDTEPTRESVQRAADQVGESVNEYVINAIKARMYGKPPDDPGVEELTHIPFYE